MRETSVGNKIVIAERDNIAAVMENGKVSEFFVHRGEIILGDVFLAQVENILPSIEAAFVNVGSDKMGFLHAQDVTGKGALQDKLKPKQKIVVQVVKEPTGHKGPRVTTEISLPGRFLVLMPNEVGVNVSKKITSAKERARLKSVVNLLKPVGVGVIVRTEAEGQTEAEIQEVAEALRSGWITTGPKTMQFENEISEFCGNNNTQCYAEKALNEVASQCSIFPIDVKDMLCAEIDTVEDLEKVSQALKPIDMRTVYMCFSTDIIHSGHINIINKDGNILLSHKFTASITE